MIATHTVYLILGSNQGNRNEQLTKARYLLDQLGLKLRKVPVCMKPPPGGKLTCRII